MFIQYFQRNNVAALKGELLEPLYLQITDRSQCNLQAC